MAKVTVQVASYKGDEVVQEALDAARSGSGKEPVSATPIRDASGKVTQVIVGMPYDIAQTDLANATAKINENPGVAIATAFPYAYTDDWASLNASDLVAYLNAASQIGAIENTQSWSDLVASSSADALGAAGHACELKQVADYTSSKYLIAFGKLVFKAESYNASYISSAKFSCKLKKKTGGTSGDRYSRTEIYFGYSSTSVAAKWLDDSQNVELFITHGGQTKVAYYAVDLEAAYVDVSFEFDAAGNLSGTVDGNTLSLSTGVGPMIPKAIVTLNRTEANTNGAGNFAPGSRLDSLLMDAASIEVRDGVL
jgi:hypothetical protein